MLGNQNGCIKKNYRWITRVFKYSYGWLDLCNGFNGLGLIMSMTISLPFSNPCDGPVLINWKGSMCSWWIWKVLQRNVPSFDIGFEVLDNWKKMVSEGEKRLWRSCWIPLLIHQRLQLPWEGWGVWPYQRSILQWPWKKLQEIVERLLPRINSLDIGHIKPEAKHWLKETYPGIKSMDIADCW